VECEAGRRAALAVDVIHDQRQVVIKSLEENYGVIPGISAATILGDGRIALIVDPEEIIASASLDTIPHNLQQTSRPCFRTAPMMRPDGAKSCHSRSRNRISASTSGRA
jgi:chemotaxis protein histidine kinase CheA